MVASSDWLNLAVADASTEPGAPIIQWWATGGAEQRWNVPANKTDGPIINEHSGMCITTGTREQARLTATGRPRSFHSS
jgi:Ricin-type beta-trefoil lectin domain-like